LAGTVVQIFAHGLDVQPHEGHLFYVGGFDKPLSCIGIQIPESQLKQLLGSVRIGDVVRMDARELFLARAGCTILHLVWEEPERIHLSFPHRLTKGQMERAARAIRSCGLAIGLAADEDLGQALKGLAEPGPAQETAIFWLLGRGMGLTPTGDDILSGFGAGLLARGDRQAFSAFSAALRKTLSLRRTTVVSEAYLSAMLAGSVNEGILAFLEAAYAGEGLAAPLAQARAYGHTSGDDMLLGLYVAFAR